MTLLGQNVDAYGRDMIPRTTFAELLHFVADVPGIERVRFVTSHPRYMSLRVVDAVASLPSMAECFMVPFQSGDNEVSDGMGWGAVSDGVGCPRRCPSSSGFYRPTIDLSLSSCW